MSRSGLPVAFLAGIARPGGSFREGAPDEEALTADIIALASQHGRYGRRRITALLREAGWAVNVKRAERIWRRD